VLTTDTVAVVVAVAFAAPTGVSVGADVADVDAVGVMGVAVISGVGVAAAPVLHASRLSIRIIDVSGIKNMNAPLLMISPG
jgi:hypothetical protein